MRIFTFGCSFSNWLWETWPEIIRDQGYEVYNFAIYGSSNVSIFHRILQCDITHKFTHDDIIIVGWTTWSRSHEYTNRWNRRGNLFNPNANYDTSNWSPRDDIVKNCGAIISANRMFNISYQFDAQTSLEKKKNQYSGSDLDFWINQLNHLEVFEATRVAFYHSNDWHPDVEKQWKWAKHICNKVSLHLDNELKYMEIQDKYVKELKKAGGKDFTWQQRKDFFKQYYTYNEILP